MPLTVVCPKCGQQRTLPDMAAGRTIPCEKCKTPIQVSAAATAAKPRARSGQQRSGQQRSGQQRSGQQRPSRSKKKKGGPNPVLIGTAIGGGALLLILVVVVLVIALNQPESAGRRADALVATFEIDDYTRNEEAVQELIALGGAGAASVAKGLQSDLPGVRQWSVKVFEGLGEEGAEALEQVMLGFAHQDVGVRIACARAVSYMGEAGRPARRQLTQMLDDPNAELQRTALECLARFGLDNNGVGRTGELVSDDDVEVRLAALRALENAGPAALPVREQVLAALRSPNVLDQAAACRVLGAMGDDSDATVRRLGVMIDSSDPTGGVPAAAVHALSQLGPAAVPHLVKGLEHAALVEPAARALGRLGADARDAVPPLEQALDRIDDFEADSRMGLIQSEMDNSFTVTNETVNSAGEVVSSETRRVGRPSSPADIQFRLQDPEDPLTIAIRRSDEQWEQVRGVVQEAIRNIGPGATEDGG